MVLVLDEAQHAITTEAGTTCMFSLKSARDTLNADVTETVWGTVNLGLVFTGSNRDKLSSLVMGRSQPFFGSRITSFPLLGQDYTDAFTAFFNQKLAADQNLDPAEVFAAFRIVESRPQLLISAVQAYVFGALGEDTRATTLLEEATRVREGYWSDFDAQWAGLSRLQQAVLERLIDRSAQFRPFDASALASYSDSAGQPVTTSDAQAALDALRSKGMIVKLERGIYVLDDASRADWFAARSAQPNP